MISATNIVYHLIWTWTRSYFAATAGNVSQETIYRYIEAQKGK
jgi:REP element-mobilizing transposase RayT